MTIREEINKIMKEVEATHWEPTYTETIQAVGGSYSTADPVMPVSTTGSWVSGPVTGTGSIIASGTGYTVSPPDEDSMLQRIDAILDGTMTDPEVLDSMNLALEVLEMCICSECKELKASGRLEQLREFFRIKESTEALDPQSQKIQEAWNSLPE